MDSGVNEGVRYFVVLDRKSQLSVVKFDLFGQKVLVDEISANVSPSRRFLGAFHAGRISSFDISPLTHVSVTCGTDGSVKLFEYSTRQTLSDRTFNSPATVIRWVPVSYDASGMHIVVGFEDGGVFELHMKFAFFKVIFFFELFLLICSYEIRILSPSSLLRGQGSAGSSARSQTSQCSGNFSGVFW